MQVKFGEFNAMQNEDIQQIHPDEIAGYIIQRSPASHFKFSVFAVDSDGDYLFCAASDLEFEKATALVDAVNKEYYPVVPSPTELVTIQLEDEQRIFSAVK